MWTIASALILAPTTTPPQAPLDLSTCDNGTLPEQVIAVAADPPEVFLLAPGWGDPRFQARCRAVHPEAVCDPARFVYPSHETIGAFEDLTDTGLRYSIVLHPSSPLEGRIEGFRDHGQSFTLAFDLDTGALDLRSPLDRMRDQLLRTGFVEGLASRPRNASRL